VFGHHRQPDERELIAQANFAKNFHKQIARANGTEEGETPVTTASDEVKVTLTVTALEAVLQGRILATTSSTAKVRIRKRTGNGPARNVKSRTLCQRRKECGTLKFKPRFKNKCKSNFRSKDKSKSTYDELHEWYHQSQHEVNCGNYGNERVAHPPDKWPDAFTAPGHCLGFNGNHYVHHKWLRNELSAFHILYIRRGVLHVCRFHVLRLRAGADGRNGLTGVSGHAMSTGSGLRCVVLAGLAVGMIQSLALSGCNGGMGGGSPPPPPIISLRSVIANYPANSTLNLPFAIAGQGAFTLLVNGTGFSSSSVAEWNGSPLPTTPGDSTDMAASVSSSLIAAPGLVTITVADPSSGVTSNAKPFGVASPAAVTAGVIALITVAPDGTLANGDSLVGPSINATGRYVAFQSNATNLAPGPASGFQEIYERDTCIGAPQGCAPSTTRITVTSDGSTVNAHSRLSSISADGRFVAFDSQATNILPGTSACGGLSSCVFLRDTCIGALAGCAPTTTTISVTASGMATGGGAPSNSANGRFVDFASQSANIVSGETSSLGDVFLRDTCNAAPPACSLGSIVVSVPSVGGQGNGASNFPPATDPSGRFVAFESYATNLVPGETIVPGVFFRDTCVGAPAPCTPKISRMDVAIGGTQPNNTAFTATPAISSDGRLVAFGSGATNLVSTNVQGQANLYIRDTCAGAPAGCASGTSLVSQANDGSPANCGSPSQGLSMSADGRFVAFDSIATNLTPDDPFSACGFEDIFVRDTCFGAASGCKPSTVRVSVANVPNPGISANATSGYPAISSDGHYVVFLSPATNLLPGIIGNGHEMVFLAKTGF
jgi:hypothetical protein